ncbi:MAG TPA: thermonuclease family protein [Nitrospirales bacterium]|nr:thermonuclease family protein [Nitrospirales bacterium]HIC03931.1 thermonuclease family protein [Nitrospirales bacterium]HIO22480.1 thermonuclease family protein [Nitrospirales bacterium]HIO69282.1 thermonuclease family protein [Nitrospirales bacterium]
MHKTTGIFILMMMSVVLSGHGSVPDVDFTRQTAHVVWVFDGDTIVVTLRGKSGNYEANLMAVDAAGWGEDGGSCYALEAAEFLRALIFDEDIVITWDSVDKTDRRGRLLVYAEIAGKDVNAEVIRRGNAWVPRKYPADKKAEYIGIERLARDSKIGLWGSCPEGYLKHRPS